jgi:hypothetical protein
MMLLSNFVVEKIDQLDGRRSFTELQRCFGITQIVYGVRFHKLGQFISVVMLG